MVLFSFIPLLPQTLGFCDIEFNVQVGLLTIYNDHEQQWNNCCGVTAGIGEWSWAYAENDEMAGNCSQNLYEFFYN